MLRSGLSRENLLISSKSEDLLPGGWALGREHKNRHTTKRCPRSLTVYPFIRSGSPNIPAACAISSSLALLESLLAGYKFFYRRTRIPHAFLNSRHREKLSANLPPHCQTGGPLPHTWSCDWPSPSSSKGVFRGAFGVSEA